MSIAYGSTNSHRLAIAAATNINDLKAWTHLAWLRPGSFAGGPRIWSKQSSSGQRHAASINTTGTLSFDAQRATTDATSTSSTALILSFWQCVAFTYDETDGVRSFIGSDDNPVAEVLYSSRAVGSGGTEVDAANPLYFANRDTFLSAFVGQIEEQAHFGRRFSLLEIQEWADNPYPVGAAVHILHGQNGTGTQIDLSGNNNHGTLTGAVVRHMDRHPPVTVSRRRWWAAVAAAGGVVVNPLSGRGGGAAWPLAA